MPTKRRGSSSQTQLPPPKRAKAAANASAQTRIPAYESELFADITQRMDGMTTDLISKLKKTATLKKQQRACFLKKQPRVFLSAFASLVMQLYWYGFTFKNTQLLTGIQRMLNQLFTALANPGFSLPQMHSPVSTMMALLINAIPPMRLSWQVQLGRLLSAMACCFLTVKAYVAFSIRYPNVILLHVVQQYENQLRCNLIEQNIADKEFYALLDWMQASLREGAQPDTGASTNEPRVVSPIPMVEPITKAPKPSLFATQVGYATAAVDQLKGRLLCNIQALLNNFQQCGLVEEKRKKFLSKIMKSIATLNAASTAADSTYCFLKLTIVTIVYYDCYQLVDSRKQLLRQFCQFLNILHHNWNTDGFMSHPKQMMRHVFETLFNEVAQLFVKAQKSGTGQAVENSLYEAERMLVSLACHYLDLKSFVLLSFQFNTLSFKSILQFQSEMKALTVSDTQEAVSDLDPFELDFAVLDELTPSSGSSGASAHSL